MTLLAHIFTSKLLGLILLLVMMVLICTQYLFALKSVLENHLPKRKKMKIKYTFSLSHTQKQNNVNQDILFLHYMLVWYHFHFMVKILLSNILIRSHLHSIFVQKKKCDIKQALYFPFEEETNSNLLIVVSQGAEKAGGPQMNRLWKRQVD